MAFSQWALRVPCRADVVTPVQESKHYNMVTNSTFVAKPRSSLVSECLAERWITQGSRFPRRGRSNPHPCRWSNTAQQNVRERQLAGTRLRDRGRPSQWYAARQCDHPSALAQLAVPNVLCHFVASIPTRNHPPELPRLAGQRVRLGRWRSRV